MSSQNTDDKYSKEITLYPSLSSIKRDTDDSSHLKFSTILFELLQAIVAHVNNKKTKNFIIIILKCVRLNRDAHRKQSYGNFCNDRRVL